jgi:hypothetical protein
MAAADRGNKPMMRVPLSPMTMFTVEPCRDHGPRRGCLGHHQPELVPAAELPSNFADPKTCLVKFLSRSRLTAVLSAEGQQVGHAGFIGTSAYDVAEPVSSRCDSQPNENDQSATEHGPSLPPPLWGVKPALRAVKRPCLRKGIVIQFARVQWGGGVAFAQSYILDFR